MSEIYKTEDIIIPEQLVVLEYQSGETYVIVRKWDGKEQQEFIDKERARKDDPLVSFYQVPLSLMRNAGKKRKNWSWLKVCDKREK